MSDVNERLKRWVTSHAYGDKNVSAFRAFHSRTKRDDVAFEIRVDSETAIESIVMQILNGVEDDAANLGGGLQHYMVYAYGPDDKKLPGRFPIKLNTDREDDEGGPDGDGIDSEPPTTQGLTRQLMRHLEAIQRINARGNEAMMATMARTIRDQQIYICEMERQRIQFLKDREELALQTTDNDIKLLEANTKQEALRDAIKQFMPLVPLGLNAVMSWAFGKTPFPATQSPIEQAMIGFVESLKPEEMHAVAAGLSPEHQAVLFALVGQIQKRKEEQAKQEGGTSGQSPA